MPDVCTDHATQRPDALKRENLFSNHLFASRVYWSRVAGQLSFSLGRPT